MRSMYVKILVKYKKKGKRKKLTRARDMSDMVRYGVCAVFISGVTKGSEKREFDTAAVMKNSSIETCEWFVQSRVRSSRKSFLLPFLEFLFWEFIFYKLGLSTNTAIEPPYMRLRRTCRKPRYKDWFS